MRYLIEHLAEHMDPRNCCDELLGLPGNRTHTLSNDALRAMVYGWHELFFRVLLSTWSEALTACWKSEYCADSTS